MSGPAESQLTSRPRVVLLGASNLTRGISRAVGIAQAILGTPLEVLIAMGHGRSYGQRSRVLGRSLPGIVDCGLWDALLHGSGRPTYALLTDIGNDVMYGASVPSILGWIQTCMDRLLVAKARIAMTLLPMAGIKQLSRWRYEVARTLLFPGTRLSQTDAVSTATQLNDRLRELGHERGVDLVEPEARWYGLDPVHIRRSLLPLAWACMMDDWVTDPQVQPRVSSSLRRWLALRLATPQQWWLFNRELGREQPARRLPDGTTVSLY